MNGFNIIGLGRGHVGLRPPRPVRASRTTGQYADRFVLADHFFTSMYGPTFPEHLYTVAAQSNGIVDNKTTTDHEGNYCDDPHEFTPHSRDDLTDAEKKKIMQLEDHYHGDFPNMIYKIDAVLGEHPHVHQRQDPARRAQKAGVDWKYYANADQWMNALQAIRHVRFNPEMWAKVQPPENFIQDVKREQLPSVSWLIPPESYNEHPGEGVSRVRGRELDRRADQRGHAERVLGVDRDRGGVGRLRRVLRPGRPPALRHHGTRAADTGADHLAVHPRGATAPTVVRSTTRSTSSRRC